MLSRRLHSGHGQHRGGPRQPARQARRQQRCFTGASADACRARQSGEKRSAFYRATEVTGPRMDNLLSHSLSLCVVDESLHHAVTYRKPTRRPDELHISQVLAEATGLLENAAEFYSTRVMTALAQGERSVALHAGVSNGLVSGSQVVNTFNVLARSVLPPLARSRNFTRVENVVVIFRPTHREELYATLAHP